MSVWRRKVLGLFPELKAEVDTEKAELHEVFWELEQLAIGAHERNDADYLGRVHGFAEWCLHHGGDLWSRAPIGFYEDLFADVAWEKIIPWLSPFAADQITQTWAILDDPSRFNKLIQDRREFRYRETVYATNLIDRF